MPIPTWKAWTDADCTASATGGPARVGLTRASVFPCACVSAACAWRDSLTPARRWLRLELKDAEMTVPTAAIAIRPATWAISLLTPGGDPGVRFLGVG